MAIPTATLTNTETMGAVTLPTYFRYKLPKPQSRITIRPTCGSNVIQQSTSCGILVGSSISFFINDACPEDYKQIYDLYMACSSNGGKVVYQFDGYWGESYNVLFSELDDSPVQGRLFGISGEFLILCVNTEPNPTNGF